MMFAMYFVIAIILGQLITRIRTQEKAERGTQDRLSVQFQLSVLRQVYPDLFVRGTVVPITLAGTRDVSHWTFTVTGEDTVDSGLGHLPALRVLSNRSTASGEESRPERWRIEMNEHDRAHRSAHR